MIDHVLCLVGGSLSQPKIDSLQAVLSARGISISGSDWLSANYALDIYVEVPIGLEIRPVVQDVRRALPKVDVALVPMDNRRKSLMMADMDSTLITSESIVEVGKAAGVEQKIAFMTGQAMGGRIDFTQALLDRVRLVSGTPIKIVEELGQQVELSPGAEILCATMKRNGARIVMVSGGFTSVAEPVAKRLKLDNFVANEFAVADGRLTGGLKLPIVDSTMKAEVLVGEAEELDLEVSQILAVGDGANDLPMIEAAGLGVAYRGKSVVQAAADAAINHTDLTTLLYFQGYREHELVKT